MKNKEVLEEQMNQEPQTILEDRPIPASGPLVSVHPLPLNKRRHS